MDAGFMWQEMKRELKEQQIEASIRMFAPLYVPAEVMQVRITNKSDADMRIRVTSAIPMYGRSADNLRDHRHVTFPCLAVWPMRKWARPCPNPVAVWST